MSEIIIRKIEHTDHLFMAVFKTTLLQGIFSLVFQDNIAGVISLNHFLEMIRSRYKNSQFDLKLEPDVNIKDKNLFNLIMNHFSDKPTDKDPIKNQGKFNQESLF